MKASIWAGIRVKTAVLIGLLSLAVGAICGVANGQRLGATFNGTTGIGSTVSVARLRISEKAWRHFEKARALAAHDRLSESDAEAQKAIAIAPGFTEAYLVRASAQVRQQSFEAAIASVVQARQTDPDAVWAGVLLAGAYNGLHRYREAESALTSLRGAEANSWQAAYEHARAAIGRLDAEAALHWSEAACAAAPERFADVFLVRANAFTLAHRWEESAAQMESYLLSGDAQEHRADVLAALKGVRMLAKADQLPQVASR